MWNVRIFFKIFFFFKQFGTENINKQLQRLDDIPLLSHKFWAEVIEKSHAPLHPFLPGREWAGEVTKVALVRTNHTNLCSIV